MSTQTFSSFTDAQAARSDDEMVCGTLREDGQPVYFVLPRDVPDTVVQDEAFQVRHGRRPTETERFLLRMVERHRNRSAS